MIPDAFSMPPSPVRRFCERWAGHARRRPWHLAVIEAGGRTWTWEQLHDEAARLAAEWTGAGVLPGAGLALNLEAGGLWVAGWWAGWLCGLVVCPMPPSTPPDRARYQMAVADPAVVLQMDDTGRLWTQYRDGAKPMDGAYVFFTSGSTGVPKGVLVGDGGLEALWETQTKAFGMNEASVSTWMLSPAFDASVSDVGCALWCGSTLVVVPAGRWKRPRTFLEDVMQHGVTHMDAPPALLALWARKSQSLFSGGIPPTLKTLIAGGEVSPPDSVDFWTRHLRWVNVYGPTEATVCSSLEVIDGKNTRTHAPTLGDPLPGVSYRVLEAGSTHPGGPEVMDGELWIGGAAVALGYLKQPGLSAERFFEDQGCRWFKTGDRVEKTRTGDRDAWIYKGRMDRQVKRHGQLLHLDEVEQVLQAAPGMLAGAVVIDSHDRLVGLLSERLDETALMAHLQSRLPTWGVPRHWFVPPVWSLTQSGKPDRAALLAQWEAR